MEYRMSEGEARKITLDGERPVSWNTYYAGSHWSIRDKEAKRVHALVRAALDPELEPFTGRVSIQITAYVKNKPMDCDNLAGKLYVDGLKGWVIDDDTPDYIESVTTRVEIDPLPRLEIIVKQTGSTFRYSCICCGRLWPTAKIKRSHERNMGAREQRD